MKEYPRTQKLIRDIGRQFKIIGPKLAIEKIADTLFIQICGIKNEADLWNSFKFELALINKFSEFRVGFIHQLYSDDKDNIKQLEIQLNSKDLARIENELSSEKFLQEPQESQSEKMIWTEADFTAIKTFTNATTRHFPLIEQLDFKTTSEDFKISVTVDDGHKSLVDLIGFEGIIGEFSKHNIQVKQDLIKKAKAGDISLEIIISLRDAQTLNDSLKKYLI